MNTKPRILFVLHLPPPVHGAAVVGKCIRDSERVNRAFDCHYVNLTTAQSLEDIGKGGLKKLLAYCKKLREIYQAIRQTRPDYVYVTPNTAKGPFYKDFVIVEWCKLWSGKKAILHFHNKGVSTRQDRWLDNLLYRRFFHHTEVILLGEPLYEDIKKYVDEKRVHYCPNGIGTGTASPPTPLLKARGVATLTEVPRILWLTNIMLTKGLMEFLDALVVLKERNVGFFVDFVGGMTAEITEEQFQQALATRGLETCTQYAGRKYGEEKERFFNGADIFVLPSYTEAFPLTILEAMQHGLPIVATNVGGISTAVENGINGILIGGGKPVMSLDYRPDAQELADALQTLLENGDLRQKMGKAGKERFEQEFTQDRFEQRMVKVLREALNSKK
jgi:glycosyltransferase involved in cell wall biosynthesis